MTPDWIKATLLAFGLITAAVALASTTAWVSMAYGAGSALGTFVGVIVVGVPVFFYAVLR